jgi:HTH-type transcriptional regulator / antitoxin HipB
MDTNILTLISPAEMSKTLADRIKALRLLKNWTRKTLAERAGVSVASLKRFETTGKASLKLIISIAYVLSRLDEINELFHQPSAKSIKELEYNSEKIIRKRGSI